jgi:hypothetical protein
VDIANLAPQLDTDSLSRNILRAIDNGYISGLFRMSNNPLFSWIKAIPYNLIVWFKHTLMLEHKQRFEVNTFRRVVIKVQGNVAGSGRYQHIRLAACPELEAIVLTMQSGLRTSSATTAGRIPSSLIKQTQNRSTAARHNLQNDRLLWHVFHFASRHHRFRYSLAGNWRQLAVLAGYIRSVWDSEFSYQKSLGL